MTGHASAVYLFCVILVSAARAQTSVQVDTAVRYQTMEGWGASSNFYEENLLRFDAAVRSELFDRVYRDLGANILCIRLYSAFQATQGGPYNWNSMAAQRMIVSEALSRGSINTIWLKVSSPPGWMKDNGSEKNGGSVMPAHYQDYADYLSYYLRHMRSDFGIRINAVSLFNEPGFSANYESTSTTPAQYRDILKVVASTFARDTLGEVLLIGPEVGHITAGMPHITHILDDPDARTALKRITTHQYGDQRLLYGTGPADNWEGLRDLAAQHQKSIWETEMFVGGPGMATRDIDEGLRAALLVHTALTRGNVTAWHYWQYHHPQEDNASQGIISLIGNNTIGVYPRYYALMQWMKHIPAGSVRIKAESDNPDLHCTAFVDGPRLVLVAFNRTGADIETGFRLPLDAGAPVHYRTSASENHAPGPPPMPGDVTTFLTVKSRSISTLVMSRGSTGVRSGPDTALPGLEIFPNPAASGATLRTGSASGPASVVVTDLLGRVVWSARLQSSMEAGRTDIDLRGWAPGPYRVTYITAGGTSSRLLIKAR